jgi:hypothetical protein
METASRCYIRYLPFLHLHVFLFLTSPDVKALIGDDASVVAELNPALERYNKAQLISTVFPGGSRLVCRLNIRPVLGQLEVNTHCSGRSS